MILLSAVALHLMSVFTERRAIGFLHGYMIHGHGHVHMHVHVPGRYLLIHKHLSTRRGAVGQLCMFPVYVVIM